MNFIFNYFVEPIWKLICFLFKLILAIAEVPDFFREKQQIINPKISNKKFIEACAQWVLAQYKKPPGFRYPNFQISYRKKNIEKIMGCFIPASRTVLIYWNHPAHRNNLKELLNTLIHEIRHSLDLRNQKSNKHYQIETEQKGYYQNSYEVVARKDAEILQDRLIEWAIEKKLIIEK